MLQKCNERMNLKSIEVQSKYSISTIESLIQDPSKGLPEDIFQFISRTTPLVNVDLLIKDKKNRTLLTWRNDDYSEPGWHIPGGIIRFKETIADRVAEVAKHELGTEVKFDSVPLAINEVIHPTRNTRGHFISLLFKCSLVTPPDESHHYKSGNPEPNEWMWHSTCPENIISVHEMYRGFI